MVVDWFPVWQVFVGTPVPRGSRRMKLPPALSRLQFLKHILFLLRETYSGDISHCFPPRLPYPPSLRRAGLDIGTMARRQGITPPELAVTSHFPCPRTRGGTAGLATYSGSNTAESGRKEISKVGKGSEDKGRGERAYGLEES